MNREFIEWLTTERIPMFDIECLADEGKHVWDGQAMAAGPCYRVQQRHPAKEADFFCSLDELRTLVQQVFPQLRTPVGEVALRKAVDDLRLCPWWRSAGPITEEIRFLMREGFKGMARIQRANVLRTPVNKLLNHPP